MDDLVRFSAFAEAICDGFQAWVMMCRNQCRLEHHVPQGPATSSDGSFPTKGSVVMRDRSQSSVRIVVAASSFDEELSLPERVEDFGVQQLVAKPGPEALAVAVLPR